MSSQHHHHHHLRATSSSSDEDVTNARHAFISESASSLNINGGTISRDPSDYDLSMAEVDGEQANGSRPPSVSVSSSMVDVSSSAASTPLQAGSHRPSPQLLAAMHDVLASPPPVPHSKDHIPLTPPYTHGGSTRNHAGQMPPSLALEPAVAPASSSQRAQPRHTHGAATTNSDLIGIFSPARSAAAVPAMASPPPRRPSMSRINVTPPLIPASTVSLRRSPSGVERDRAALLSIQQFRASHNLGHYSSNPEATNGLLELPSDRRIGTAGLGDRLGLGPHGTRATRSMSDSMLLDDDDSEDHQLLPTGHKGMRNRSHSAAAPGMLPLDVLQEPRVWTGRTSRVLVVCASGVLLVLLFIFCAVVGLRMAAHAAYSDSMCMSRERITGLSEDYTFGYTSAWTPQYRVEEWKREWFVEKVVRRKEKEEKAKQTAAAAASATESPDGISPSTSADTAASPLPITKSPYYADAVSLFDAGKYLSLLRLHHFVTMGTHNSYHVASNLPLSMHQYTHASLPHQLFTYRKGVRQLELDVHLIQGKSSTPMTTDASRPSSSGSSASTSDPPAASSGAPPADQPIIPATLTAVEDTGPSGFVVYHLQWLDDRTTCYCLSECLELISAWSLAHPAHFPIFLTFEIKSQLWEDVDTGLRGVTCEDVVGVEGEILKVFARERLILPLEVRGGVGSKYKTVQEALNAAGLAEQTWRTSAVAARRTGSPLPDPLTTFPRSTFGWPRLIDSLGKIVVVWLDDMHNLADRLNCLLPLEATSPVAAPQVDSGADAEADPPSPATRLPDVNWHNSDARVLFIAQNSMDKAYSSIITQKHPAHAMRQGIVTHALKHGYMVRTMTDDASDALPDRARFAAALASGAHLLSTDFEECIPRAEFHIDPVDPAPDPGNLNDPLPIDPVAHRTIHAAAAVIEEDSPLPGVIPPKTPGGKEGAVTVTNTSELYCEHLPSEWPFECNPLSAPFFCRAALQAVRIQMEFMDEDLAEDKE